MGDMLGIGGAASLSALDANVAQVMQKMDCLAAEFQETQARLEMHEERYRSATWIREVCTSRIVRNGVECVKSGFGCVFLERGGPGGDCKRPEFLGGGGCKIAHGLGFAASPLGTGPAQVVVGHTFSRDPDFDRRISQFIGHCLTPTGQILRIQPILRDVDQLGGNLDKVRPKSHG